MKRLIIFFLCSLNLNAATVLFLGDSHSVGPFGWAFDQHLRDAGHEIATFAVCGSIPLWFSSGQKTNCGYFTRDFKGVKAQGTQMTTPLLGPLLSQTRPDVVVMAFGTNYVNFTNDEFIKKDIKSIISKIKATGAQCFWISDPDTRKYRAQSPRILKLIEDAAGNECPIFNSSIVTRYPETGGDGVHYWSTLGTPIANSWAAKAFESFELYWK